MKKKYVKSSVIFVDEESLLPNNEGWSDGELTRPLKSSKISRTLQKSRNFPATFRNYLFSQNSILTRLFSSLLPPFGKFQRVATDFEGLFLSIFLLSSILYLGFVRNPKIAISRLHALLSSASLSLGYVIISSIFIRLISLLTKTVITFRQAISVMGYGCFGHACTLFLCETSSDKWFIPAMIILGGLDTMRICFILFDRTPIPALRFLLCTPAAIGHILYLVYLHFAIMKDY